MPIYDFKCRDCGKVSEVFLRKESGQAAPCPDCGGMNMDKLFSASYSIRQGSSTHGDTCCGRAERCESPPCSRDEGCHRR